jgi:tRNA-splicing ligase RtcB
VTDQGSILRPRTVVAGGVQVKLFVDERIAPDERAIEQLRALSRVPLVADPLVALPDIHYKHRNPAPTGIVVAVEGGLIPLALDAGLNCGMRVHLLECTRDEVGEARIERLFEALQRRVPTGWRPQPVVGDAELDEVLSRGAPWVIERRGGRGGPAARIENGGRLNLDGRPREVFFGRVRQRAIRGLGVLGGGNHFLELHVVDGILHEHAAALGLAEGRLLVIMHSGSGIVGKTLGLYYGERDELSGRRRRQFQLEKAAYHFLSRGAGAARLAYFRRDGFPVLAADSREGRRYLAAMAAAANFGYANRAALGAAVEEAVAEVLGPAMAAPLLYDLSHVLTQREVHGGRELYIHRHGASRALPASRMDEPVFAVTGQPVPVPGSMGAASYLCVGREEAAATYFSANHGAGRTLDKPEARRTFAARGVREELAGRSIRLFKAGAEVGLAEQAPGAFKDVDAVIDVMDSLGIATPVARTRPLATMKG